MKQRLVSIAIFLSVCLVAAGGYYARQILWPHNPPASGQSEGHERVVDQVNLTETKLAEARIELQGPQRRRLQPVRTVPGRIEYNATRHVAVKSPTEGLVQKVAVIVGTRVDAGQLLSVVNSPELGTRRADVLKLEAELELARRERDWWKSVQSNLDDLLSRLKRPQEIATLEEDFDSRVLGDYRRDIFTAYSKFRTAEAVYASLKSLKGDIVSQRMVLEQTSLRDSAVATFHGACEQATFDVRQKVGKAEAAFEDASRRLAVARQTLTWLTGQSKEQSKAQTQDDSLSTWPVVAPFAATVEEIYLAESERVRQGEDLLLLADTSRLWVQADIRDKDWPALTLSPGQQIQVQSPAFPNKTLEATIAFIGRTVSAETRAAPLVADIQNNDGLLKPGMFVRILLPSGESRETLTVPESAIIRHEDRVLVFVQTGERQFTARDVKTGMVVEPWIEIISGLTEDDRVAVAGTFMLKSELLLEPEEE